MDQIDFNKLWENFVDTITNHYADFSGRVGRSRFWYYILVSAVVGLGVSLVGGIIAMGSTLQALYALALFLPNVGMTMRRLQDTGRPGIFAWLLAVPVAVSVLNALFAFATVMTLGLVIIFLPVMWLLNLASLAAVVVLIYFCAQPGTAGSNEFGPAPATWTPGKPVTPTAT
jgi:uncharacterized membrane protein YhaH (DUF805 family)